MRVIKIWDFQSLVHSSYLESGRQGLTGGTYFQKVAPLIPGQEQQMMMGEMPRMIPVLYNNKPYLEEIKAFRVSRDGIMAACVLKSNEILIYRFFDAKGEFIPEKNAAKPVKVLKIKDA
mmetsp:Transcript_8897/g.6644  ORF Transcript_8897/g.6644 Transcript_8897/m.6644 type:complete len:119 (+) Transcript_8897:444-800(+)